MDEMKNLGVLQAVSKFWGNLTSTQRFVAVVFISTSVVALTFISILATKPKMSVLFSGLQPEDAGSIVAKLQEKKVAYEVDGSSILVPEKNVAETRMDLASQGLPKGGTVGFELFDKNSIGMTEFSQHLNYQRALQGELARSINEIEGVQDSRVHIVIPDHSVFLEDEKQASASIVVKLRGGTALNPEQVSGIVHLVSSAVEGLKTSNINVIDTNGNELSTPGAEADGLDPRMSSSQMQLKRTHEKQMEHEIQTMLERVLGPNKAIVRVNAKINFDREEQSSETYAPLKGNAGVLASEVQMHETYDGASSKTPNKPATGATTADKAALAGKTGYDRLEMSNKYEISKKVDHLVKAPGQIERLTVAVMVDGDVDSATKASINNAVTMAAGIDMKRGDQIRVESMKFDNSAAKANDADMKAMASRDLYMSVGKMVGAGLLILIVLIFLKQMISKINLPLTSSLGGVEAPMAFATMAASQLSAPPVGAPPIGVPLNGPGAVKGGVATAPAPQPMSPAAAAAAQVAPEEVAQVLKRWISES